MLRKWRRFASVFAFCGMAGLLAGTVLAASPSPMRGGRLRVADDPPGGPFGVPWKRGIYGSIPASVVFEAPFWGDARGRIYPYLVERWELSTDRRTLTLRVRRNVRFHDGTELDAEAMRFNVQKQIEHRRLPRMVQSAETVDRYTLRVNLSEWHNGILLWLDGLGSTEIVSPRHVQRLGEDRAQWEPVGTGPFRVTRYDPNAYAEFVRFPGYWDPGKPYLDRLEMRFFRDQQTLKAALLAGQLDVAGFSDPVIISELKATGRFQLISGLHTVNIALIPDSANADSPLADRRVREAVYSAIDRESIARALGYGIFEASNQIAHPGHDAALRDSPLSPYDPARARRLLAEAGYPDGFRTRLIFDPTVVSREIATALQGYLERVGVRADLDMVDRPRFAEYQQKGWRGFLIETMSYVANFNSWVEFFFTNPPAVYASMKRPPELEKVWQESRTTLTPQRHKLQLLHRVLLQDLTVVPVMIGPRKVYIAQPYVRNTGHLQGGTWPRWRPGDAWIAR